MGQGYQGSGKVFYLIMLILSAYSFKLPTRRFIHRFYEKIGRNLDLFKELDELPNFTN